MDPFWGEWAPPGAPLSLQQIRPGHWRAIHTNTATMRNAKLTFMFLGCSNEHRQQLWFARRYPGQVDQLYWTWTPIMGPLMCYDKGSWDARAGLTGKEAALPTRSEKLESPVLLNNLMLLMHGISCFVISIPVGTENRYKVTYLSYQCSGPEVYQCNHSFWQMLQEKINLMLLMILMLL